MFDTVPVTPLQLGAVIYVCCYAEITEYSLSKDWKLLEDRFWRNSWGYLYTVKSL